MPTITITSAKIHEVEEALKCLTEDQIDQFTEAKNQFAKMFLKYLHEEGHIGLLAAEVAMWQILAE